MPVKHISFAFACQGKFLSSPCYCSLQVKKYLKSKFVVVLGNYKLKLKDVVNCSREKYDYQIALVSRKF